MSHYHIDIPVNTEDIKIIKRDFENFITDVGGFSIEIRPDGDNEPATDELAGVLQKLFIQLITHLAEGRFKGIN